MAEDEKMQSLKRYSVFRQNPMFQKDSSSSITKKS